MIELRRLLMAGDIASTAEFFSFGTNDLTQTTYGISRDDARRLPRTYIAKGILEIDPFISVDRMALVNWSDRRRARAQDPPRSQGRHLRRAWRRSCFRRILPRDRAGLRLVFALRVPIARLAAAQAALGKAVAARREADHVCQRHPEMRGGCKCLAEDFLSSFLLTRYLPLCSSARLPTFRCDGATPASTCVYLARTTVNPSQPKLDTNKKIDCTEVLGSVAFVWCSVA